VSVDRHCAWVLFEKKRESINALSTLAMAAFTIVLGWATVRTLTHLRESSARELRAYLFVFDVDFVAGTPLSELAAYHIIVKNSGQTPAYSVEVLSRIDIGPAHSVSVEFPEPKRDSTKEGSRAPLGPNSTLTHKTTNRAWDNEQRLRLNRGDVVYVHGVIAYEDIFGEKQWTRFRLARHAGSHNLVSCEAGNEAKRS
jgi:hypothetical protein